MIKILSAPQKQKLRNPVTLNQKYQTHTQRFVAVKYKVEMSHEDKKTKQKLCLCSQVPTKNIEGQLTPYYPVEMGHGTECSLKQNTPRATTVLYVCHPEAKHEILTIAEVITCQYQVVVLTPLLCSHPRYRYIHKHIQSQFPLLVLCDIIQPIFPQVQVIPSE